MYIVLDIARGIAALGVFLFHIRGAFAESLPFIAKLAAYGSLGVPLFFVLSGFVITASAEHIRQHGRSPNAFLKARFLRIFPPFWVSILVVCAIPYLLEAISSLKTGHYSWPSPRFLSLTALDWLQLTTLSKVFAAEGGDLQGAFNPVNSVYWTLAIEFQFYLLMYAALLSRRAFRPVLAVTTVLGLLALWNPPRINPGLFIFFWPMFSIGIGVYYLTANGLTLERLLKGRRAWLPPVMVALLLGAWVLAAYSDRLGTFLAWLSPSPGFSFALWCGLVLWCSAALEPRLLRTRREGNPLARALIATGAYLGVISYSLYLMHGKVSELPTMFARQVLPAQSALLPVATVVGTVLLCALFYRYVERPCMSTRQRTIYYKVLHGTAIEPSA
jgi:peptidoglycan/LPS O-acetylase OafA/YrhL